MDAGERSLTDALTEICNFEAACDSFNVREGLVQAAA